MLVVTRALFLASFYAFYSSPTEGATLPLRPIDGRPRPCPPPFRTLPDLNAIHGDQGSFRPDRQFLREWCPPEVPVVFLPRPTSTTIWGRDVSRRFSGTTRTNPHRGLAVEGGSVRITFPGQHITATTPAPSSNRSSEEDEDLVEFINSKMHPSLLRPRGQPVRPTQQLGESRGASEGEKSRVTERMGRL